MDIDINPIINPEELEVYEALVGFRPYGRGHHFREEQRRQITLASTVYHWTPRDIQVAFSEGGTTEPLCSIGRIRNITNEELQDVQG